MSHGAVCVRHDFRPTMKASLRDLFARHTAIFIGTLSVISAMVYLEVRVIAFSSEVWCSMDGCGVGRLSTSRWQQSPEPAFMFQGHDRW